MANILKTKTWKLDDGKGRYALLTYDYETLTFTVVPTDMSYNPIDISELNNSYILIYQEALIIIAEEQGKETAVLLDIENELGYLETATQITIDHGGGSWVIPNTSDRFSQTIASLRNYLNEISNAT